MKIDRRLDRVPRFDPESKRYGVMEVAPSRELISKVHLIQTCLNQGREGACVGFGITHALLAEPHMGDPLKYTAEFARTRIYYPAQESDPWPGGEYPGADPVYGGTSVLDGLKAAKTAGEILSYRWAFSMDEILVGIGYFGPAIAGVDWYEGMQEPDSDGRIHVTGAKMGGHCTLISGFNKHRDELTIHNSWGKKWGKDGKAYISVSDFNKLRVGGEFAFIEKVKK